MEKILILFFCILGLSPASAQQQEEVLARVNYSYFNQMDTLAHTKKPRNEQMVLFIGRTASLYTSFDKIRYSLAQDQRDQAEALKRSGQSGAPSVVIIDDSPSDWMSKTDYFFFFTSHQLFAKQYLFYQAYLMEEPMPKITWELKGDTANFLGIRCRQAIGRLNGREWTAWYAPELPFQSGPWKLNGLPGLIIEACNKDKSIEFKFAGFTNAKTNDFTRLNDVTKRTDYVPGSGRFNNVDILLGRDIAAAYFENTIKLPSNASKTTQAALDNMKTKRKLPIQKEIE
jgi:GLPGLI family protein